MSVNFHSLQYNEYDEYLYERNINSNFDIVFNNYFFFKQEKDEDDLFDINKLYFTKNKPQNSISQALDETNKNENRNSMKKDEENPRKNDRSKLSQIEIIIKNGKQSEEKEEKIKKNHKNFYTREYSDAPAKSENQENQLNRKENIIFCKSDKKMGLNEINQYYNFLLTNTINTNGKNNIDKSIEININKNKANNNNEILNNNINIINTINNIDSKSNNVTNIISNNNIDDNKSKKNNTILNKKTKRGTDSTNNKTNNSKYITKIKIKNLDNIIDFINEKIKTKYYGNTGKIIIKKEILNIDKRKLYHSSAEFDKKFLNKTLKEILSDEISGKYSYYPPDYNKHLIQDLINEENTGLYFKKLFELTFLNCLEHIRGTKFFEELDGLVNIDEIFNDEGFEKDKDEIDIYKRFMLDYEGFINRKKSRNSISRKPKNN